MSDTDDAVDSTVDGSVNANSYVARMRALDDSDDEEDGAAEEKRDEEWFGSILEMN